MIHTRTRHSPSGAIKLSQDLAKLVNNRHGSDVRFLIGGSTNDGFDSTDTPSNGGGSEAVTMYGHSAILRGRSKYFAAIFEDDNDWKEKSSGILRKPNVSPIVFHVILYYIYTGSIESVDEACLPDVIAAAEEMELEDLSTECQAKIIDALNQVVADEGEGEGEINDHDEDRTNHKQRLFGLAVSTLLVPSLILANNHVLSEFFGQLIDFTLDNIEAIISTPETTAVFLDNIPLKIFKQILISDSLDLQEFEIWDLALNWACHQTNIMKHAVESQIRYNVAAETDVDMDINEDNITAAIAAVGARMSYYHDEDENAIVSIHQLKTLKLTLAPLIPAIRFGLMEPEQYSRVIDIINFFIPQRRSFDLQRLFFQSDKAGFSDVQRATNESGGVLGSKIIDRASWKILKKWIFEANCIPECQSPADLCFRLLYRASLYGFKAAAFHERCDQQGPTLVLVKSSNGHLFGGVNFSNWISSVEGAYSAAASNFLFALKDGKHRHTPAIFRISRFERAAFNRSTYGPIFGSGNKDAGHDLLIANDANSTMSKSTLPMAYEGAGANNEALAGSREFIVANYEVFAISRK